MSKLDFKSIYENIQLEKEYGITNEEDEKKESSDKEDSKENKTKATPESIIKDMMKFEPAQLLKFVAQQEDSGAKTWLLKNLIPFAIYAVKNNYIKAKALGSAIKNIGDKNKDDETGIDYDNVEIEESSIKTVYAFDDETIEKLQKFIDEYKKEMEAAKDDIETSSEELSKDIKKSGVKIEGEKLADNALTVAGVIDNEENKGKSGKELTKIVDQKIEAKKEIKEIEKNAEEIKKLADKIKVDPKYEKMSPEELDKLASKGEKKNNKESDDSKLVKELSEKVKSKIGKDYKSSVVASIFDGDEFRKFAKQLGFNLAVDKVAKAEKIAGCRVDYYDDEASDVVAEGDSGWKINILKGDEKNKGLKKITDYIEKQMKAILKDKLGKIYKIRRRWTGDNPDGEFDSIFVFAEYRNDVKESISEADAMVNEAADKLDSVKTGFAQYADGTSRPVFSYSTMSKRIRDLDYMLDDGKLDGSEYKKILKMGSRIADYQQWAAENANSKDPTVLAKVAQINMLAKKFNEFEAANADKYLEASNEYNAAAGRIPEAGENGKNVAKLADNEETKEVAKGWLGKAAKVLRVFGQAKIVAKFGKFVLNQGKEGVDAIGGQYVKFKEDQNVVAEMKFILMNAKDSSTKHSDTKFSVRFDTSDLKWHLTNLDDRKAKIEKEDVLMKKILDTKECKEFKKECLDNWTKLLQPKDEVNKFVPYFIKNYDKLGVKITDKNQKKYFDTLKKLVDNFDEVKRQFA